MDHYLKKQSDDMATIPYTLHVDIGADQYTLLKSARYHLIVAKKVDTQYNVFFNESLVQQTYIVSIDGPADVVLSSTLDQPVTFGKTCIMGPDGIPHPAHGQPDDSGNRIGANASLISANPLIFTSPDLVDSKATDVPIITLAAWFDLHIDSPVIIADVITAIVDVPYERGTSNHAVGYVGPGTGPGTWVTENTHGQVISQPRRSYKSVTGFTYEDSGLDPYAFVQAALSYIPTGNSVVDSTVGWLAECKVSFPTPEAADNARAYLKQKVIYNIHQRVSDKTDDVTFHVKLRWGYVMFMPEMMAGSTDEDKIQNAFNAELKLLAVAPISSDYITDDQPNIVYSSCVLLAYGTHIALDRDVHSQTAVVGDNYKPAALDQEWKFIASPTRRHFIIEGAAGGTYLSVDGEPKEGAPVIHSTERMDWNVEYLGNAIRISVPDTNYCVELGGIISPDSKNKVHKVVLAKRTHEKTLTQLWKVIYPLPEATTKQ